MEALNAANVEAEGQQGKEDEQRLREMCEGG